VDIVDLEVYPLKFDSAPSAKCREGKVRYSGDRGQPLSRLPCDGEMAGVCQNACGEMSVLTYGYYLKISLQTTK